jgi:hypothetical protein
MNPGDSDNTQGSKVGRKAQVGGALAVFIGILLLFFGPSATPGVPLNPHGLAYLFIGLGIFLVVVGTVARIILLP